MIRRRMMPIAALISIAAPADAGVYADDLAKCLVSRSTPADQSTFMRWFFSALAASPATKGLATITPDQHRDLDRQAAGLFDRLMLIDCRAETVAALRYEGGSAIESGFGVLGQIATRRLMSDPEVARELSSLGTFIDGEKLKALGREAGIPTPPPPAPPPAR